jgi:hypothetical protein
MENKIILTSEEIQKIKEFQEKNQELVIILGQIELQKLNLDISKDQIKQQMIKTNEEQFLLSEELQSKYGEGQIDIENGLYLPFIQS